MPDLSKVDLFVGVAPDLVAKLTDRMVTQFNDRDVLLREGDVAHDLVVLLHGRARVTADGIYLVSRGAGDVIGEQAFIENQPRSATVTADGSGEMLCIPEALVSELESDAGFMANVARALSSKLRESTAERAYRYRRETLLFTEFRAHVSQRVLDDLLRTGASYGSPRFIEAVILFSDIRSFTDRSAAMEPDDVATQLSTYLDAVVDLIHEYGGFVDKFIGDAVMAFWGYAGPDPDDAIHAFECAKAMTMKAQSLRFGAAPIKIGVGLNAGRVFIGNIGGEGKKQFTVLGSPVNLAARFESESKELEAPIVMGHAFATKLPSDVVRSLTVFADRPIKGGGLQTLYAHSP